jgi:hypothetical protein
MSGFGLQRTRIALFLRHAMKCGKLGAVLALLEGVGHVDIDHNTDAAGLLKQAEVVQGSQCVVCELGKTGGDFRELIKLELSGRAIHE